MYTITKSFHFSASHLLTELPANHPCKRLHGHNYIVIIELEEGALNNKGFLVDYRNLDVIKHYIDEHLDHRHLNEVIDNPTSERLAKHIFSTFKRTFPQLSAITVKETPQTSARYEPIFDKK